MITPTPPAGTSGAPPPGQPEPQGKQPEGASQPRHQWRHLLGIVGPGLVTGAADDDPSGIATYSQTGAQFGYGQLWTAFWLSPLLMACRRPAAGSATSPARACPATSRTGTACTFSACPLRDRQPLQPIGERQQEPVQPGVAELRLRLYPRQPGRLHASC